MTTVGDATPHSGDAATPSLAASTVSIEASRSRSTSIAGSEADETSSVSSQQQQQTDEQLLASLDSLFFEKHDESAIARHTLNRLEKSGGSSSEQLLAEYERALGAVNTQLAERVMSNYNLFVEGMGKIHELGLDLQQAAVICKNGRRLVAQTQRELTSQGLRVAATHRKRQLYRGVLADLGEIQAVLGLEHRLREALDSGNFPHAIALCVGYRRTLQAYEPFTCLASFHSYVENAWLLLQKRLEHAVRAVVLAFDAPLYERMLLGHRRMGRGFHVLERLQRQFIDTINENTQNALYAHVLQSETNAARAEELKGMRFKELSDALSDAHFVDCLHTILEYLCDLLYAHYQMTRWHAERDGRNHEAAAAAAAASAAAAAAAAAPAASDDTDTDADDAEFFASVASSLQRFRKTMWDKMQRKVAAILSTSALASYKIDEFLLVLDSVYRFIEVGEAFSGQNSDHLRRSIKQQSKAYFENVHRAKMEDLATMLSHDQWQPCPVADDFALAQLKEFAPPPPRRDPSGAAPTADAVFERYATDGNPFGKRALAAVVQARTAARKAANDAASTLSARGDNGDGDDGAAPLVLTSTTINVAKYIGKYLQMMHTLEPIAYQIFLGLAQLFDFYLYAVYRFFVESVAVPAALADEPALQSTALHSELRATLERMAEKLSASSRAGVELLPRVADSVATLLADANGLHGAAERVVACESLGALARAVQGLQPRLASLLAERSAAARRLAQFFAHSVGGAAALQRHAYTLLSSTLLPFDALCRAVDATNWASTKQVDTQYNPYVDKFKEEYRLFAVRAAALEQQPAVPRRVLMQLWAHTVARGMEALLEGYARAKKCSDEGQLLRKLDLQELTSELQRLAPPDVPRPLPRQADVAMYIRTYYHEPDMFLPWVKEHQEHFTQRQVLSILNQGFGRNMKSKLKKDLMQVVNEIYQRHVETTDE